SERSPERRGERNRHRERAWDSRVGTVELRVPRERNGSFFPSLLEPRKRAERALAAVVREAYLEGVSTRRVDDPVPALVASGSVLCSFCSCRGPRFPKPASL